MWWTLPPMLDHVIKRLLQTFKTTIGGEIYTARYGAQ